MTRTPASAPAGPPELPTLPFASRAAWETWLEERHGEEDGVWVKLAKKGTGIASVTYAEAVEVALCYGWIDGQSRRLDETYWLQKFTPRRARSKWSKINRERATELIERGLMRPAGLREVERARADGRWEAAYASPSQATVPDDLQAALDANEAARTFFATLDGRNRYAILHRLHDAKRPETRARRIEQYVTMLSEGRTLH
ncbi:YdeI family protein [Streptomyces sp. NPDC048172]|uniref:YdeI/OmpD-associated family protein n=1 Tax=Streptomyces sp. NPDC048172 TaxID=3365505 RepID=UPI00371A3046